jgi:hypothetical protein
LAQRQWNFYPINLYRRLIDGTVVPRVTNDFDLFQAARMDEKLAVLSVRILEERGRGTLIKKMADQGRHLSFLAWLKQPVEVEVLVPTERLKIEYWMFITLQPVPDDDNLHENSQRTLARKTKGDFSRSSSKFRILGQ